jgi:hypothetical protein
MILCKVQITTNLNMSSVILSVEITTNKKNGKQQKEITVNSSELIIN